MSETKVQFLSRLWYHTGNELHGTAPGARTTLTMRIRVIKQLHASIKRKGGSRWGTTDDLSGTREQNGFGWGK